MGKHNIVRKLDFFEFKNHLCIVYEVLSINLYELLKKNRFRGLSLGVIRVMMTQLLDSLKLLSLHKIIHCDIKPENILLKRCAGFNQA
jgi:dual specificity protein kinase YAK1